MNSSSDYKAIFEGILTKSGQWSRIAGSQFVTMISTFVGQMVSKAVVAASRYHQESFLTTAVKRASILAAAEDRGYIGRRRTPSTGTVTITNLVATVTTIPQNTPLLSKVGIDYVLPQAIEIPGNGSVTVPISQLKLRTFSTVVTVAEKFMEVLLPLDVTAETHRVDVFVSGTTGAAVQWEKRYMFRRTNASDPAYTEFYKPTEQLGVRFGNGINGRIPAVDSTITLNVWTTLGETTLIDGQPLDIVGDLAHLNDRVTIVTASAIVGGDEAESDEETRAGALYVTPFDQQIVWDDDYAHFIRTNLGNILWVNAWGEKEQEEEAGASDVANINKIFVSAYSDSIPQNTLEAQIIDLLTDTKYLNKRYQYVPVNLVPFTITLTGKATGDKDLVGAAQVIRDKLVELYGKDPKKERRTAILEKDVNQTVRDLGLLYDFSVDWGNYPTAKLADYVYLDVAGSTITLTYLEE